MYLLPNIGEKIFYGQKRLEIGKILREISEWQEVKIIEAEVYPDHVHMFVEIPPKLAVSKIKRQKQPHNFPEVVKFEVRIWPAKLLVPWLLYRHGR